MSKDFEPTTYSYESHGGVVERNVSPLPTADIAAFVPTRKRTGRNPTCENRCLLCDGPVPLGSKWAMCVDGSTETLADPADETAWAETPGFMGFFRIGGDCRRKLIKAGVPESWFVVLPCSS